MKDIERDIRDAELRLQALHKEKERQENLTESERFAEWMHGRYCTSNHTDACGWFYETDWTKGAHARYLKKADDILQIVGITDAMEVIKAFHKYH